MRLRCALSILVAVAAARADDTPAPAPDSMSAAKKDLAAVRALSGPAEASVAGLPSVDMKAVNPGPGGGRLDAPAPLPSADDASADPSKKKDKGATGNWLVDAMERKPERERSRSGRDALSKDDEELQARGADRGSSRSELESQGGPESAERDGPKQPTGPVYNPLEAFMAGWISPRDRELLLPARAEGAGEPAGARPAGPQDGALQGDFSAEGFLSLGELGASIEGKSEANPYLGGADLEQAPAPRMFSGPTAPDAGSPAGRAAPAWFGSDAGPVEAPRTFIPDFARPADDDKYFKQMKKF